MNKPKQVNTKPVESKQKPDIYDVNKYSTKELYSILDLNNPTDRELEAKILFYINKYDNVEPSLYKFFNDIYGHFFEVDDQNYDTSHQNYDTSHQNRFTNMFSSQATNLIEGFDVSFNGLDASSQNMFVSSEIAVYDKPTTAKPGSSPDVSFNVGTQDVTTVGSTSIGYTTSFNFPKGNLNPLLKETIKRIISIDSQYRDYTTFPISTFFTFNLSDTLIDVVSLKLYSVQIPYTWYTIKNGFGSNFFYIKGVSPGIDNGNSDYKFTIPSGNYSAPDLITQINNSITHQVTSLIEVDLSNTSIVYTPGNAKCTFNINIIKRYNDINYYLSFPSSTNPGNNIASDTSSRFNSIPGFLGLLNNSNFSSNYLGYSTYTVYSKPSTIELSTSQTVLNNNNNNFNIIFYTDKTGKSAYNSLTSQSPLSAILVNMLNISLPLPISNQIPIPGKYVISSILQFINDGFAAIPALVGSTIMTDSYTIDTIDPSITILQTYYRYKINIKLNRKVIPFYDGMKAVLQFPNDQILWLTSASGFNFDVSTNELNNIISEVNTPVTSFAVSNNPYIYLKCNAEYYGHSPNINYYIDDITTDICGNPILPTGLNGLTGPTGSTGPNGIHISEIQNNKYTNSNPQPQTINIISNNSTPYYIGMGNYTITNDNAIIVNKTINITTGNIHVSGNATIYGQNYNVNGNALINGQVNVIASPLSTNITTSSSLNRLILNAPIIKITESILNGNINIQGNLNILGNVAINNIDASGLIIDGSNYALIGNTQIQGNIIIAGLSQILNTSTNTIYGSNYYIIGNSFINGTTYSGNTHIISGNAIVNSSRPYIIYGQTPSNTIYGNNLILTGNTNIIGNINLNGNANLYNLYNTVIVAPISTLSITTITDDSRIITTDNINYTCNGNISINSSTTSYNINSAINYIVSGQDTVNNQPNSIIVNGNVIVNSGNAQISSTTPYIISQISEPYSLNGNINITGNTNINNANIQINSSIPHIGSPYTINGENYTLINNTYNIYGNTKITTQCNIQTNPINSYLIQGNVYSIQGNATIQCSSTIQGNATIQGNVNITSISSYTITGQNYSIQTPTNLQGNIVINSGNLYVSSIPTTGRPYIIKGNNYNTSYTTGDNIIQGNTYIVNGNSIITGNTYSIYGNIIVNQDTSFNDYIIDISNSPTYLLNDYLQAINNSMLYCIGNTNLKGSGSSMTIDTNNTNHHSSMKFNIQNVILSSNYVIDLTDCYLSTSMKLPQIIQGNVTSSSNTSNFSILGSGYIITPVNNKIVIKSTGLQNKVPDITLLIPVLTYDTILSLQTAINELFTNNIGNNISMHGTKIHCLINSDSTITTTILLNISAVLDESVYTIYLYDNNLIINNYQNIDIPRFYGSITYNWITDTSTNTWLKYLDITNQNYNLYGITDTNYQTYGEVFGNDTIQSNNIILDENSNYFYLKPISDPLGGVYTTISNIDNTAQYNDIRFDIPVGTYSKELLITYINNAFNNDSRTAGSSLSFIIDPITFQQYTKLRLNVITNFTSKDFMLDFYDSVSFTTCNIGISGKSSIQNVLWDETLGWILGFRNAPQYYLTQTNQNLNINTNQTYYDQFTNTLYSYDSSGAHITGDTCVSVFLYNYFMVILDDYVQNHLNDGLVTITNTDFNIPLPSYANRATFICDPITHKPVATATTTNYNSLTQKQLYAANEILNVQQTKQTNYSSGPFIQDIFGLVPIKTSGMQNGQPYIEFGGSLQLQERTYFGPVNIRRMTIKLVNDKGVIVDLNGANWSFSLICEQLYSSNSSK